MQELIDLSRRALQRANPLPFSVYASIKEQHIFNVPVINPTLICILEGCKKLGRDSKLSCPAGSFLFLSNNPKVEMRNIPDDIAYFALIVEFEFTDFDIFTSKKTAAKTFFTGDMDAVLRKTLQQLVEWSGFAPPELWAIRRREILQLLYHSGYTQLGAVVKSPSLSQQLYTIIAADISANLGADALSSRLAMSESTLRRKLHGEGTSLQVIKDRARLGHGLHLLQSTLEPVGIIAERCGYLSQSRFTDKFKQLFGLTPTELRRTRMPD
ncbi:helix-turn-helix transcriptional regulator [Microbulbifer sp. TYP-18]|uniref:helix-turn-helix transcriptional regulator n=1 Tax=Microbulbifer sp. TYP-18 TaxID=3230024 RepID=UPI0034C69919